MFQPSSFQGRAVKFRGCNPYVFQSVESHTWGRCWCVQSLTDPSVFWKVGASSKGLSLHVPLWRTQPQEHPATYPRNVHCINQHQNLFETTAVNENNKNQLVSWTWTTKSYLILLGIIQTSYNHQQSLHSLDSINLPLNTKARSLHVHEASAEESPTVPRPQGIVGYTPIPTWAPYGKSLYIYPIQWVFMG